MTHIVILVVALFVLFVAVARSGEMLYELQVLRGTALLASSLFAFFTVLMLVCMP